MPVALPVAEDLVAAIVRYQDDPLIPRIHVVGIPFGEIRVQRSRFGQVTHQIRRARRDGSTRRPAAVIALGTLERRRAIVTEGEQKLPRADDFEKIEVGLARVELGAYVAERLPTPAEVLWMYINLTPMAAFVSQAPDDAKAALERGFVEGAQPFVVDGVTVVDQPMVVAIASR